MHNPLFRSVAVVTLFWFTVLLFFSGLPFVDWWLAYAGAAYTVGLGLLGGVLLFVVQIIVRGTNPLKLSGRKGSGEKAPPAKATIVSDARTMKFQSVRIPSASEPRRAGTKLDEVLARLIPEWTVYARRHPLHARVMLDVLGIMRTKPRLPAAPNPGDHNGRTLEEHSANVVKAMLAHAPSWRFTGQRDTKGKVIAAVQDTSKGFHEFEPGDPILLLAAFAHDIGKVACYQQIDPKRPEIVEEIKPRHGPEGAAMLRRLQSVMALPLVDREALLLAVGYYHGASELPIARWVTDKARSLTLLLYDVDCIASSAEGTTNQAKQDAVEALGAASRKKEGLGTAEPAFTTSDIPAYDALELMTSEDAPEEVPGESGARDAGGESPAEEGAADGADREPQETKAEKMAPLPPPPTRDPRRNGSIGGPYTPSRASPQPKDAQEGPPHLSLPTGLEPVQMLCAVLSKSGAMNVKKGRIALWVAPWIYVNDAAMRVRVQESFGVTLDAPPNSGSMAPFTWHLLRDLDQEKRLMTRHEGNTYTHKRAMFKAYHNKDDAEAPVGNYSAVFVVRDDFLPESILKALRQYKDAPRLVPMWGESSAHNKRGAAVGVVPATPQDDQKGDQEGWDQGDGGMDAEENEDQGSPEDDEVHKMTLSLPILKNLMKTPKSPEMRGLCVVAGTNGIHFPTDLLAQKYDFDVKHLPPGLIWREVKGKSYICVPEQDANTIKK